MRISKSIRCAGKCHHPLCVYKYRQLLETHVRKWNSFTEQGCFPNWGSALHRSNLDVILGHARASPLSGRLAAPGGLLRIQVILVISARKLHFSLFVLSLCVTRFYGRVASFLWASGPCLTSSRWLCALEQREKGTRSNFPGLLCVVVQAVYHTTLGAPLTSEML